MTIPEAEQIYVVGKVFMRLTIPLRERRSMKNEPIVCTPEQAIDCFLKKRMDALYIGNRVARRK